MKTVIYILAHLSYIFILGRLNVPRNQNLHIGMSGLLAAECSLSNFFCYLQSLALLCFCSFLIYPVNFHSFLGTHLLGCLLLSL